MPNWCQNRVLIKGPIEEVTELLKYVEDDTTTFSLNKIIPMPQPLENTPSPQREEDVVKANLEAFGAKDWYDWHISNWGTKWNVNATINYDSCGGAAPGVFLGPETREVDISFDSAWNPPLLVYPVLAKLFPNTNIYISYDESGCDFAGWELYTNGEKVKSGENESWSNLRMYYEADFDIFEHLS